MKVLSRIALISFVAISFGLIGCFSYTRDVQPAPTVVEPLPATSASVTTSTTTTGQDGYVKKQTTTTYGTPY
jgi:hypothetical protein